MADSSKHGKKGKGHRQNIRLMLKDLEERDDSGRPRIRITIEGKRDDLEKVTWTFRKKPVSWK